MIKNYIGIFILSTFVIGVIIYGFNSSGSPAKVRAKTFDAKRVSDIAKLEYDIENFYVIDKVLPANFSSLYSKNAPPVVTDPETKKSYIYIPGIDNAYKLCAVFSLSSMNDSSTNTVLYYGSNNYKHPAGHYCFDFTAPKPPVAPTLYLTPTPSSIPTSIEASITPTPRYLPVL